ncbi:hypothetical protein SBRCBS47491_006318 [Sporothrix bragantina]|uniref:Xylanolytic transcriptional activator regulatory domain-containing protein n=1 Tax=Sporothrix bragantina TaxID=671064 RepID=A0ABP0C418_9PEZI
MASTMGGGHPQALQPSGSPGSHGAQQSPPALAPAGGGEPQDQKTSSSTGQSPLDGSPANTGNSTAQRIIKRRSPVACRSVFPTRGAPDMDREYRHPRMKGDKARKESNRPQQRLPTSGGNGSVGLSLAGATFASPAGGAITGIPPDPWDMLPPLEQVVDAVNTFTRQYFQLGFIPRHTFIHQLREQPRSISLFLLLSLLSVSGRMTPSLVKAYGGADSTAELFMDRASTIALTELYQEPTLPRCQAFYLLSLAQQGSGYRNRSYVNLGIALRMAILMKLHREESYTLEDPTPTMIQNAESARRTLWMLYSQDNLHADPLAPISLSESDITTLLPSSEEDFNSGTRPTVRAALEDTTPAHGKPALANTPTRSLFATLMQSHQLWGIVLRRTIKKNTGKQPWDVNSEYASIKKKLNDWENSLPAEHLWSRTLLREHKAKGVDLAYVAVTMVTRLCNILIRKVYIPFMLVEGGPKQHQGFWRTMSGELFSNVKELFTQIDCWVQEQEPGDGTGAQLAVFCVYSLCPDEAITRDGKRMLERTMDILKRSTNVWPLARRWIESIERFIAVDKTNLNMIQNNPHEGGMAEGKDPIPSALHPPLARLAPSGPSNTPFDNRRQLARQLGADSPHARSVSPSVGGNNTNGIVGGSAHNDAPIHLPQLRTDASLINSPMRLPPPQPSPNLVSNVTGTAAHYAPVPTSLPAPLVLPPPATQGLQINGGGGGMRTPTGFQTQVPNHQHHQSSPHQSMTSMASLPQLPPMPPSSQTPPDNGMGNLLVQRFDGSSMNTTAEAEAAAVLVGGMVHHGVVGYGGSQVHHQQPHQQQQQQHGDLYSAHQLADQGHGMHVDLMAGNNMSLMDTVPVYDTEQMVQTMVPDDGFQNELQAWAQGPGLQAGGSWASSVYSF